MTAKPECIYIRVRPTMHLLIIDNLLVWKSYFDSNIVKDESAMILGRFSKDYFEADGSTCLNAMSSKREI